MREIKERQEGPVDENRENGAANGIGVLAELNEIGRQWRLTRFALRGADLAQARPGGPRQYYHRHCASRAQLRERHHVARLGDDAAPEVLSKFLNLRLGLVVSDNPAKIAVSNAQDRVGPPHSKACCPYLQPYIACTRFIVRGR